MNLSNPLTADNFPTLCSGSNSYSFKVQTVRTYPVVLAEGVYHFNVGFSSTDTVVYISAWGAEASGPVNGY